jgi:Sulfotransferase family
VWASTLPRIGQDALVTDPAPPLVHIGHHKTATTWLQRLVFDDPAQGYCRPWPSGSLLDHLIVADPDAFDGPTARTRLDAARRPVNGDLVPVASHERLSGSPHTGGHDSREIADRLAAAYPDGRVLIVVREQRRMALSCWRQFVKIGGPIPLDRYLAPAYRDRPRATGFHRRYLEYHRIVGRYQRLFGPDRVLVLPFELLGVDPVAFLARIADFSGAPRPTSAPVKRLNEAHRPLVSSFERMVNVVVRRDIVNPMAPVHLPMRLERAMLGLVRKTAGRMPETLQQRAQQRQRRIVDTALSEGFHESNRLLAAMTGLDLAPYGYQL